jgi:hypothetical protein
MKKIRIYHPHTHNGINHDPDEKGVEIEVSDQDADFIKALKLDQPKARPDKPAPASTDNTVA